MCRTQPTLAALLLAAGPAAAADAPPPVGTVKTVPVLTVALEVNSTGQETKRAVYAPPPGWYVRSHRVVVASRHGAVTYAVSTVPAGWDWRADSQSASAAQASGSATVSAYKFSGGGQGAFAQAGTAADRQSAASSHHALMVEAAAKGAGLWMGGSGIEFTVVAELVYVGK
jgi:hypothetical protein